MLVRGGGRKYEPLCKQEAPMLWLIEMATGDIGWQA